MDKKAVILKIKELALQLAELYNSDFLEIKINVSRKANNSNLSIELKSL